MNRQVALVYPQWAWTEIKLLFLPTAAQIILIQTGSGIASLLTDRW